MKAKAEGMTIDEFQRLPTEEAAQLVREAGAKVCVFPINGTRRWFMLEHPHQAADGSIETYLRIAGRRHIELYRLLFDHGIDTLLTPVFGPDLLDDRGGEYMQVAVQGLLRLAKDQGFSDFYRDWDVRVRVYGDAHRYFQDTPHAYLLDAFEELTRRTAAHQSHRLFFGVCAHDAAESVVELGVRFYQESGRLPSRRQIIEAYYGEYVEPVDLFIGFDRPSVFDMPLIATGREDLYFTVSPSPYLDEYALRAILYDHLYARQVDDSDYARLPSGSLTQMRDFYLAHRGRVLGIGREHRGIWYPLPQVNPLDS